MIRKDSTIETRLINYLKSRYTPGTKIRLSREARTKLAQYEVSDGVCENGICAQLRYSELPYKYKISPIISFIHTTCGVTTVMVGDIEIGDIVN